MRRKYIGVGLMAALVFSAAPLSGTAGGETSLTESRGEEQQKCVVVSDVGNGNVTVKKNKHDSGTTVQLASGDSLVVCLSVMADIAANAVLNVVAEATPDNVQCDGSEGTGVALSVAANVAVEPGFGATANLTATAHANAAVGDQTANTESQTATTGDVVIGNDPDDPDGIAPALGADAGYCKTVDQNLTDGAV